LFFFDALNHIATCAKIVYNAGCTNHEIQIREGALTVGEKTGFDKDGLPD
jgi:hypothetical protein